MRLGEYPFMILFIINVLLSFMVYISLSMRLINTSICKIFNNWIMMYGKESMILLCLNELIIAFVRKIMFNNYSVSNMLVFIVTIIILTFLTIVIKKSKVKVLFGK